MPPRFSPRTLAQWPWVVVRIDCVLCKRRGRYRLARLAAKYGPEQSIDGLLRDLAHDCPWWNERARKYEPRCGARLTDLEHAFPPPDHPDEPIYRQRQPSREDLPKPPPQRPTVVSRVGRSLPPSLAGWPLDLVGFDCRRCSRCEMFDKAKLLEEHGDVATGDLLKLLARDCPRQGNTQIYELCGALFVWPYVDDQNGTPGR